MSLDRTLMMIYRLVLLVNVKRQRKRERAIKLPYQVASLKRAEGQRRAKVVTLRVKSQTPKPCQATLTIIW